MRKMLVDDVFFHNKRTFLYFAYGSNLWLKQMEKRCFAMPFKVAKLYDHEFHYRRYYASVKENKGKSVWGALYIMDRFDIIAMNKYEGFPHMYYKKMITVFDEYGRSYEAFTYVADEVYSETGTFKSYFDKLKSGYIDWGLPVKDLINNTPKIIESKPLFKNKKTELYPILPNSKKFKNDWKVYHL